MTAITPETFEGRMLRVISANLTQRRLVELVRQPGGEARWWVDVTRELDDLAEAVSEAPGDVVDVTGFVEQIRSDAPHLMVRWERLAAERDEMFDAVCDLRLRASLRAGDPTAVVGVCIEIRQVLDRVRRFQRRTTDLLLDAYVRDLGGD